MSCDLSDNFCSISDGTPKPASGHRRFCSSGNLLHCRQASEDFDRLRRTLDDSADDSEPHGGWESFENRLSTAVNRSQPARLRWLAVAAAVVLASGAFELGRRLEKPNVAPIALTRSAPQSAPNSHFEPHEISQAVSAFDQVSKVFDGRASWMLVSHESSDVGVVTQPVDSSRKCSCCA